MGTYYMCIAGDKSNVESDGNSSEKQCSSYKHVYVQSCGCEWHEEKATTNDISPEWHADHVVTHCLIQM